MSSCSSQMQLIDCNQEEHSASILSILNEVIANSTALYDYVPRTPECMHAWFAKKLTEGLPIIGVVDAQSNLLGFATWGSFRSFPAYKYTVEHSVYVHHDHRGRGLGKMLLSELVHRARYAQVHAMIGCIDSSNTASIHLHTQLGFIHTGTFKEVGYKFGRWLDAAFYQLNLDISFLPQEG